MWLEDYFETNNLAGKKLRHHFKQDSRFRHGGLYWLTVGVRYLGHLAELLFSSGYEWVINSVNPSLSSLIVSRVYRLLNLKKKGFVIGHLAAVRSVSASAAVSQIPVEFYSLAWIEEPLVVNVEGSLGMLRSAVWRLVNANFTILCHPVFKLTR